ncbi:coth protein-domain-containing protein [Gilbertella persicaria]|uniref:coth protein-domain-containing protein n=1 Tax=Gilbertella persicaria TaxID=101096 RepID=UPI00221ECAB7|nr:coth protein-domain-containing protein [Gilbertella persicaria]KAI8098289.1 coth protein-domain-containing protein [Gilbertella persicaria]
MIRKVLELVLLTTIVAVQAHNITYNVIASSANNFMIAVNVDDTLYPLHPSYGILFQGEAPAAKKGYRYSIINADDNIVNITEPFLRPPLEHNVVSTPNHFFNRSIDIHELNYLPQALEPISALNRVQSDLHIPSQIPTIHIYGNTSATQYLHENQLEDIEVNLDMTYISLDKVYLFEQVGFSLAGRSSRWVPKLSYGIKLNEKNDTTLFGYKNLKLRALSKDPTYIRENLAHNVLKSSGIPSSGYSYVRLFIDNQPIGLFGLIETFQDPWVATVFANNDKDYASGYLYQGEGFGFDEQEEQVYISDLRYEGTNISKYDFDQYDIKAGPSKNPLEDLIDLQTFTKFINDSSVSTTPESEWEKRLDVDCFSRAMAIENLIGLSDAYMTLGNNYYLYQDPRQSGRFIYISTDFDDSLGRSLFDLEPMLSGNYAEHPGFLSRPLTRKLFSYPVFLKAYEELLLTLSNTLVNPSIINPYLDSVAKMIIPDVEWDFKLPRLGTYKQGDFPEFVFRRGGREYLQTFLPAGVQQQTTFNLSIGNFDESLNGPSPPRSESIKTFIAKKHAAIMDFYNERTEEK